MDFIGKVKKDLQPDLSIITEINGFVGELNKMIRDETNLTLAVLKIIDDYRIQNYNSASLFDKSQPDYLEAAWQKGLS